jgi:hypothetical protein
VWCPCWEQVYARWQQLAYTQIYGKYSGILGGVPLVQYQLNKLVLNFIYLPESGYTFI